MKTTDLEHMDVALRLAGYNFKKQHVELILNLHDLVEEKGGEATLLDMTKVIDKNEKKYEKMK